MLARQLSDQVWAALRSRQPDIERVAADGPQDSDRELVRCVFKVMLGDLFLRSHDATGESE